jgi:hypothetical protein
VREQKGREDDDGFTLVELVVTTGVIVVALFVMATVLWRTTGVAAAAESRTRAQAVATREIEAMRAIPWDALGHAPDAVPAVMPAGADPVVVDSALARVEATSTVSVGPDDFVVERYVFWDDSAASPGSQSYKRAIVRVSWTVGNAEQSVEQDSAFLTTDTEGSTGVATVFAPSPANNFAAVSDHDDACQPVVTLSWTTPASATDRPASWTIQRSVNPGDPDAWTVVVDGLIGDSETYPDANPALGVATTYRIIGFNPGNSSSASATVTMTPSVVTCVTTTTTTPPGSSTTTTTTTAPPSTTTTTAATCVAVPQAASPSAVDRFTSGANAGTLKSNVYVEVVVNPYCGPLWLEAEPQTGSTYFEPMLTTGSVAAETIPKSTDVWSLGNKELRVVDSLGNVVATLALTVTQ